MARFVGGSSRLRRSHNRILARLVDINLLTVFVGNIFVIGSTAFVKRFKEELTIVVWAAILPPLRNSVIVGAVCSME